MCLPDVGPGRMGIGYFRRVSGDGASPPRRVMQRRGPPGFQYEVAQVGRGHPGFENEEAQTGSRWKWWHLSGRAVLEFVGLGMFTLVVASLPMLMARLPIPQGVLRVKEVAAVWCTPSLCFIILIVGVLAATSGVLWGWEEGCEQISHRNALAESYLMQRTVSVSSVIPDTFVSQQFPRGVPPHFPRGVPSHFPRATRDFIRDATPWGGPAPVPIPVVIYQHPSRDPPTLPLVRKPDEDDEGGRSESEGGASDAEEQASSESLHIESLPPWELNPPSCEEAETIPDVIVINPEVFASLPPRSLSPSNPVSQEVEPPRTHSRNNSGIRDIEFFSRSHSRSSSDSREAEQSSPSPSLRRKYSGRKSPSSPPSEVVEEAPQAAPEVKVVDVPTNAASTPSEVVAAPANVVDDLHRVDDHQPKDDVVDKIGVEVEFKELPLSKPSPHDPPEVQEVAPESLSPTTTIASPIEPPSSPMAFDSDFIIVGNDSDEAQQLFQSSKPREVTIKEYNTSDETDNKDDDVDQRVEEFLRNFRAQMRLQRQESERYTTDEDSYA